MALIRTGHNFSSVSSVVRYTELTEQLLNLGISSEMLESTMLKSSKQVNGSLSEIILPDSLVQSIYALYNYDEHIAEWVKVLNYKQVNNKILLNKPYYGLLLLFPSEAFRDSYYDDGDYYYEMFLSRLDRRVYREIIISSSSYKQSNNIELRFSLKPDGPWLPSISSPFLISTFYLRVSVSNLNTLKTTQVIPSELITLTCLTCE